MSDKLIWALVGAAVGNKTSRDWLADRLKKLSQIIDKEVDKKLKAKQSKKAEEISDDGKMQGTD